MKTYIAAVKQPSAARMCGASSPEKSYVPSVPTRWMRPEPMRPRKNMEAKVGKMSKWSELTPIEEATGATSLAWHASCHVR
eukprot:1044128-Pleurochrysis_carterae.AAC.2